MDLTPHQIPEDSPMMGDLLRLMRDCFAYMEGRIDPPSSLGKTTLASLRTTAAEAEIWVIGMPPVACMILSPRTGTLYLGKICVAPSHRQLGLSRHLVEQAERTARRLKLPTLELQSRVELVDNHATFKALGFSEHARTAHPGYDRPTSITMRKPVV